MQHPFQTIETELGRIVLQRTAYSNGSGNTASQVDAADPHHGGVATVYQCEATESQATEPQAENDATHASRREQLHAVIVETLLQEMADRSTRPADD